MKRYYLIVPVLTFFCLPLFGQKVLRELKFDSWFGYGLNSNTKTVYCLLGTGFFRTPSTDNTDSLISIWTEEHPNAQVIPVYTSGPVMTDSKDSKMTYVWLVDKSDTLNVLLVRLGCVPGSTMQRPPTWDEMDEKKRKLFYNNEKPDEEVHLDRAVYKEFLRKIETAEGEARRKKLGIWAQRKE